MSRSVPSHSRSANLASTVTTATRANRAQANTTDRILRKYESAMAPTKKRQEGGNFFQKKWIHSDENPRPRKACFTSLCLWPRIVFGSMLTEHRAEWLVRNFYLARLPPSLWHRAGTTVFVKCIRSLSSFSDVLSHTQLSQRLSGHGR